MIHRLSATRAMVALAGLLMVTGCAEATGSTANPAPTSSPERSIDSDTPPPVTVRFLDQSIDLTAWSYCYGNTCADGVPPDEASLRWRCGSAPIYRPCPDRSGRPARVTVQNGAPR